MQSRTGSKIQWRAEKLGKSEKGRVEVRAYHRGNHIFIEVEDDGRGIDYENVRRARDGVRHSFAAGRR